ncbi:hypothetical protein FJV76_27460 [Mesorhizobium sp. WSM4303]|uniref:hypothetical protein n=1 Tax=unclassified Mesorhizobium TaxID=325217 RepID=UPI00115D044F|nr:MULTISPECIES: hypothetical protein [unclassified Mesorhizobium]TRC97370.1 hypothetical protein FJV76_27460 [Mesorhizobium sp. WSM4303]TRC98986.1 hypothetical protein FJV77_06865 [Mesorhizobium sp. WSM4306]
MTSRSRKPLNWPILPLKPHPDMRRALRGRQIVNDIDFYRRYPEEFHGTVLIDLPDPGPLDKAWSALGRLWPHRVLWPTRHHSILTTEGKALTLALIAPSFQRNAPGRSTVVEGILRKD